MTADARLFDPRIERAIGIGSLFDRDELTQLVEIEEQNDCDHPRATFDTLGDVMRGCCPDCGDVAMFTR